MVEIYREDQYFWPRAGENANLLIEQLKSAPTAELDLASKREVLKFEADLFSGQVGNISVDFSVNRRDRATLPDILELNSGGSDRVAPAFFLTPEGRELAEDSELPELHEAEDAKAVAQILTDYSLNDPKKLTKKLVGRSVRWVKVQYQDALETGSTPPEIDEIVVVYNPDEYAQRLCGLLSYSRFLRSVSLDVRQQPPSNVNDAKLAILKIYRGRINDLLAATYPAFLKFDDQVASLPDEAKSKWLGQLQQYQGSRLSNLLTMKRISQGYVKRLDIIRNGIASNFGPSYPYRTVSMELLALTLDGTDRQAQAHSPFNDEEIKLLNSIKLDTSELRNLLEASLQEAGLLSEYEYDTEKDKTRKGPAPDDKWQIETSSSTDSLGVKDSKKVMVLSDNFSRSVIDTVNVGAHEIQHVQQEENSAHNEGMPKLLGYSRGKGKRYLTMEEMGGVYEEDKTSMNLFGGNPKLNFHYVKAMWAYEETGSEFEAMRAFRDSMVDQGSDREKATKQAVDRVMRLTRRFGGFNSQPLAYAERLLVVDLMEELPAQVRHFLINESSVDLIDAVRLHRFGLLVPSLEPTKTLPEIFRQKAVERIRVLLGAGDTRRKEG